MLEAACSGKTTLSTASSTDHIIRPDSADTAFSIWIADAELRDGAHLPANPVGKNSAALLLTQPRLRKVAKSHKGDDVEDELVFIEDGVDDHWYKRGQEGSRSYLSNEYEQATSMEHGAIAMLAAILKTAQGAEDSPSTSDERPVAPFDARLDVHREMRKSIDLNGLSNVAKNE